MLKINLICIGKLNKKYIIEGIKDYEKRLSKYINLSIIELKEEINDNINKESAYILEYINRKKAFNILLDVNGENISSDFLAKNQSINFKL